MLQWCEQVGTTAVDTQGQVDGGLTAGRDGAARWHGHHEGGSHAGQGQSTQDKTTPHGFPYCVASAPQSTPRLTYGQRDNGTCTYTYKESEINHSQEDPTKSFERGSGLGSELDELGHPTIARVSAG